MDPRDDATLIDAAGRGDREAFTRLVERHHRAILRFIDRFRGARGRAEDLAQDVFLAAWRAAPRFRPRANVATWLLRIAYHACLNDLRAERVRATVSLEDVGLEEKGETAFEGASPGPGAEPSRAAIDCEQAVLIRTALDALPDRQRAALVLRHGQGLSYAEIAEALESSRSAVETLLFRARRGLREAYERLDSPKGAQGSAGLRVGSQ